MAKRWQKEQISYLKRYSKTKTLDELAKRFRTDETTVQDKLSELGLTSKDLAGSAQQPSSPAIGYLDRAIKALFREKWEEASKLLEKVVAEADQTDVVAQARAYLEICRNRLEEAGDEQAADPYALAVYERNRGNLDEALAICSRGGRRSKDDRFAFLAASIQTITGNHEEAAKLLAVAIELNPKNRIHAYHDPDFEQLRQQPEYSHLFGAS